MKSVSTFIVHIVVDQIAGTEDGSLIKAQDLIKRINKGDLYKAVGSKEFDAERKDAYKKITNESVWTFSTGLKPEEIKIEINKFGFSLEDKDPLEYVSFYNVDKPGEIFTKTRKELKLIVEPRKIKYVSSATLTAISLCVNI